MTIERVLVEDKDGEPEGYREYRLAELDETGQFMRFLSRKESIEGRSS
jgi:hypothetical protein